MALLNKAVEIFNCGPKNFIINSYCTAIYLFIDVSNFMIFIINSLSGERKVQINYNLLMARARNL